jgi:hypothetical protein
MEVFLLLALGEERNLIPEYEGDGSDIVSLGYG